MLSQSLAELSVTGADSSFYTPSGTSSSDTASDTDAQSQQRVQRAKLNEFLSVCNIGNVAVYKRQWKDASLRTRESRVSKAKESVVAALNVIVPGDAGPLWEALKASQSVEAALSTPKESPEEKKYLEALAETYYNASSCTRRQILSVMADLTTLEKLQGYIPDLTSFRFKEARKHKIQYGRGVPLPMGKSPRLRVRPEQLDHFLSFITSPHISQDLPFGQRYLHLSSGKVLETPNVIRTMIPQRIVKQYEQYCDETGFKPFRSSTMLRILDACSATVRKSLQGLDYIAAEGAKGFDDLLNILDRHEERGLDEDVLSKLKRGLKEGKQYIKTEYKVIASIS